MADPAFYPHAASRVERRDTHISAVFLTGEWVYKLKKPVNFGFLDFTTLEARRTYCRREVILNQRLSREVYEGVVAIRRDEQGKLSLVGPGEPVEYAVKMKQLPDDARLKILLKREEIGPREMKALGVRLAEFYERSARSSEIDHFGDPEVIEFNMEENFTQVEPFVGDLVEREEWEFIRQVSRTFFRNWKDLFRRRIEGGRIRDGHGDLRADHIYFFDSIQIIDCIEFNDRFRYGDVICDLAYLHMDLEHLDRPDLSLAALAAYVHRGEDPALYSLLDFYSAYRAVVKLKVACLSSLDAESAKKKAELKAAVNGYLEQAYRYAMQFSRPSLWVFCGLPATGKSTLAGRLSETLSISLFQSDRIRKEAEGRPQVVAYNQGPYRAELRNRVYGQMLALAQEQLKSGHSAILDASFSRRKWREEARQLASDLDTNLLFVECVSRIESIGARLEARETGSDFSDARLLHLPDMIEHFEPLVEASPETHLRLETDEGEFPEIFEYLLSEGYARKCAQVRRVL
jgi:aminoglycoside phosphotransferase family enzyme/predicted kinase